MIKPPELHYRGDTGILGMGEFNVKQRVCELTFDGTLMYVIASFTLR
jgi:hypothetical protein